MVVVAGLRRAAPTEPAEPAPPSEARKARRFGVSEQRTLLAGNRTSGGGLLRPMDGLDPFLRERPLASWPLSVGPLLHRGPSRLGPTTASWPLSVGPATASLPSQAPPHPCGATSDVDPPPVSMGSWR